MEIYFSDLETEEQEFCSFCYIPFIYVVITLNSSTTTDLNVHNSTKIISFPSRSHVFSVERGHFRSFEEESKGLNPQELPGTPRNPRNVEGLDTNIANFPVIVYDIIYILHRWI